jgi:hypothetical protein
MIAPQSLLQAGAARNCADRIRVRSTGPPDRPDRRRQHWPAPFAPTHGSFQSSQQPTPAHTTPAAVRDALPLQHDVSPESQNTKVAQGRGTGRTTLASAPDALAC